MIKYSVNKIIYKNINKYVYYFNLKFINANFIYNFLTFSNPSEVKILYYVQNLFDIVVPIPNENIIMYILNTILIKCITQIKFIMLLKI